MYCSKISFLYKLFTEFTSDEDSVTTADYAILMSIIMVSTVVAINTFRDRVTEVISNAVTVLPS